MLEAAVLEDKRLELAYEAGVKALAQQDTTLGSLRNRATGLLSAITLATSFTAGLGLFGTDSTKGPVLPLWSKWTLLALLVAIGGLCLGVMWPVTVCFGVAPDKVLAHQQANEDVNQVRLFVIGELIDGHRANNVALAAKFRLYRVAVASLTAEIAVLVLALIL